MDKPLAAHLKQAATTSPSATALISHEGSWDFAKLQAAATERAAKLSGRSGTHQSCGSSLHLALDTIACSQLGIPYWPAERELPPLHIVPKKETALIIATSGSEGHPKHVMLSIGNLDTAAAASNARLPLHPGDLWLHCLPLYHIGGQAILWRCLRTGAGILLHDGFDARRVASDLHRYPVTHISLVPAMLARLLEIDSPVPPSLQAVLIGGAALSANLYQRAMTAGWPLRPSYGMSETAAQIASWQPADGPWQTGLAGRPLSGSEIRIGADGRIHVRGPQVMLGYMEGSGPDDEGWLITGDLGHIDTAGRLTVLGRADDILISGGRNVHPQEIETCLAALPGIRDIAITSKPDPVWGDKIIALLVGEISADQVFAHARAHLPSAAIPREVKFFEALPRTTTGKLQRGELRRMADEGSH